MLQKINTILWVYTAVRVLVLVSCPGSNIQSFNDRVQHICARHDILSTNRLFVLIEVLFTKEMILVYRS